MSARHPGNNFPVNLSPEADQSQSPSYPCFGPPLFVAYKRESSAGDIIIDVHLGFLSEIGNNVKMQRAEYIYITDLEGSTG